MRLDPLDCQDCPVRALAICAGLDEADRLALAQMGKKRRFARGEAIFRRGDRSIACATLVRGAVKLSRVDSDGTERTIAVLQPGGMLAQLFATDVDSDAIALTQSELCVFPRDVIEREMQAHVGFMERVLKTTTEELASTRAIVDLVGRPRARARVAGLLFMLAKGCADGDRVAPGARVPLPMTRGEMASLLGLTIETVSRELTKLEREGIIARDGARAIRVANPPALDTAGD